MKSLLRQVAFSFILAVFWMMPVRTNSQSVAPVFNTDKPSGNKQHRDLAGTANVLQVSKSGKFCVTSSEFDCEVSIWDLAKAKRIVQCHGTASLNGKHSAANYSGGRVYAVCFSKTDEQVFFATANQVFVWDWKMGVEAKPLFNGDNSFPKDFVTQAICVSGDGSFLVVLDISGDVVVTRLAQSSCRVCFRIQRPFDATVISPKQLRYEDSAGIFVSMYCNRICTIDPAAQNSKRLIEHAVAPQNARICACSYSTKKMGEILSCDTVGEIRLFNSTNRESAKTLLTSNCNVDAAAFSQDGELVAIADADGFVTLYSLATMKRSKRFQGARLPNGYGHIEFLPGNTALVATGGFAGIQVIGINDRFELEIKHVDISHKKND